MRNFFVSCFLMLMTLLFSSCTVNTGTNIDWTERNEYTENDEVLFRVFTDPTLAAGKLYGYMISFTEPFETYKNKKLAIYTYHKETGERIIAHPPQMITEPSPGYASLNRFTTRFTIPYSGLWRYEVVLDDRVYGEVVFHIKDEWNVSPLFKAGNYSMIGEEGRLGFIYDDTEVTRFYPNKEQKYMWHFWGQSEQLQGSLMILGTSKETGDRITVFEAPELGGPNNGADAHIPSSMSLPSVGLWRLDAYISEEFFGSVIVEVYEQK